MILSVLLVGCKPNLDAPPSLVWDQEVCTECGMLVGDPAYAAALVTKDGGTLPFDDPGCLFKYVLEKKPALHAMWFHDGAHDRWLREQEVAFTAGHVSPMGSGLMPVPAGTPTALTVGEASASVFAP